MSVTTTRPGVANDHSAEALPAVLYVQAPGHPRPGLHERLARSRLAATIAVDAAEALRALSERPFQCVIVDLARERVALTTIRLIRARHPNLSLVGIVDPANTVAAAEALQHGVMDLLPWPFDAAQLAAVLANARDRVADPPTTHGSGSDSDFDWFLGSVSMRDTLATVTAAAAVRQGVAVSGEVGTGHEIVARAIHGRSGDAPSAYVEVAGGQSADGVERQLFGNLVDRIETPNGPAAERISDGCAILGAVGGTLYVSNVLETPARVQARLARLLRDREGVTDAGQIVTIEMRFVAAVEGTVVAAIADGRLRRDLADRLVSRIELPPLRRRSDDIPRLAAHYLREACRREAVDAPCFTRAALTFLSALSWPRNTVDLATLADALATTARGSAVQLEDVLAHVHLEGVAARVEAVATLREGRRRFERECITAALARHHGRVGEAAKALGIQRTNLYRKVRQLKVDRSVLSTRRT